MLKEALYLYQCDCNLGTFTANTSDISICSFCEEEYGPDNITFLGEVEKNKYGSFFLYECKECNYSFKANSDDVGVCPGCGKDTSKYLNIGLD